MSDSQPILMLDSVSKCFERKKHLFDARAKKVDALCEVTCSFDAERIYGIVGESGCGKTTLAKIIVGLESQTTGTIIINGEDISDAGIRLSRGVMHLVFQNPFHSFDPRWTLYDSIIEGLSGDVLMKRELRSMVNAIIDDVGLSHDIYTKFPHQLSGGECQRAAIARALVRNPQVLILDEPTASLDVCAQVLFLDLIKKIVTQRDMIVICVSHDLPVVRVLTDYVYVMREGAIVESGNTVDLFSNAHNEYTKTLLQHVQYGV